MTTQERLFVMVLLEEAKDRVWRTAGFLPRRFETHCATIERKLVDLIEDMRNE